jgi:acetyl-CoA acyltransferase
MTREVYIVDAVRTPVGKAPRGAFKHVRPDDLLVHSLQALHQRQPNMDLSAIEDVIIGCAMPEAEQGMNVARMAVLLAGYPDNVPAMTINRFCSSGIQTVAQAADSIASGNADMVIAGGVESMSMVPMGGNKFTINPEVFTDEHIGIAYGMGLTAELVAKKWEISQQAQIEFAFTSHQRAIAAQQAGYFEAEIAPFEVTQRRPDLASGKIHNTEILVSQDEGPRADTSIERMAKLRSPFALKGSVTAATSSQMSDGSAAALVVSEDALKKYNLTPIAKFRSFAVAGVPPEIMGIGPVKAIPLALQRAGLSLADIDWIELNEAFAAQSLAVMKDLELDHAKVNPQGGAIALGHPLGATGAIRLATLVHGLKRTQQKYGMITMCIGTGMGAAAIIESM